VLSARIDLEGTHFRPNTRRQLSSATGHGHHPRDREADTDRKRRKKRARRILTYATGLSPPSRFADSPDLPLFRPCAGTNGNYFSATVDDCRICIFIRVSTALRGSTCLLGLDNSLPRRAEPCPSNFVRLLLTLREEGSFEIARCILGKSERWILFGRGFPNGDTADNVVYSVLSSPSWRVECACGRAIRFELVSMTMAAGMLIAGRPPRLTSK